MEMACRALKATADAQLVEAKQAAADAKKALREIEQVMGAVSYIVARSGFETPGYTYNEDPVPVQIQGSE